MTTSRGRAMIWPAILLIGVACSGDPAPTTTEAAQTTQPTQPTAPTAPTATTTTPPASSTTSPPSQTTVAAFGYTFRQLADTTTEASVTITYPVLTAVGEDAKAINDDLDNWARTVADDFLATAAAAPGESMSILEIELAPELLNQTIFSISGVSFEFDGATDFSLSRRYGFIYSIPDRARIAGSGLFIENDLVRLAESAATHLVADVLGDPAALNNPDGLLPEEINFDAVWLTPTGVGVGFDQYQVAAGDAGSPAIVIPYAELGDVIDTSGILSTLEDGAVASDL